MKPSDQQTTVWEGWNCTTLPYSATAIRNLRLLRASAGHQGPMGISKRESRSLLVLLHGIPILPAFPRLPWGRITCDRYAGIINLFLKGDNINCQLIDEIPDILLVDYANDLWGIGHELAESLPPAIGSAIETAEREFKKENPKGYNRIVFIGHSFGSLLMRRVLVDAVDQISEENRVDPVLKHQNSDQKWYEKVNSLIVLSGSNLGFKIVKPKGIIENLGAVLVGITEKILPQLGSILVAFGIGRLVGMSARNSAWIVDTRILWLRNYEGNNKKLLKYANQAPIHTLYINGADDQLVGDDDLEVVYQLGDFYKSYSIKKLRHQDILDIGRNHSRTLVVKKAINEQLNEIRKDIQYLLSKDQSYQTKKDHTQTNGPESQWIPIKRVSALHENNTDGGNSQTDEGSQRTVIFLIHGIRDFAEWQEEIDYNIRCIYKDKQDHLRKSKTAELAHDASSSAVPQKDDLAKRLQVIHVKYGYFNALQFVFPSERARAIRSFSDEFYQLMARFPDLKQENIHVYAHSNGTFVFGEALRRFSQIRVNRVIIAGSVLPPQFDWKQLVKARQSNPVYAKGNQILEILNYAANKDWPTGLLCRGLGFIPGWRVGSRGLCSGKLAPLLGVGPGGTDGFIDFQNYPGSKKYSQNEKKTSSQLLGWNFFLEGDHGASLKPGCHSAQRIARYLIGFRAQTEQIVQTETMDKSYKVDDLDNNIHPFNDHIKMASGVKSTFTSMDQAEKSTSTPHPYPSRYRGFQGNLRAILLLILVAFLILWLFGVTQIGLQDPRIALYTSNPIILLHSSLLALALYILSRF